MTPIGRYQNRQILWTDFKSLDFENLPDKDWLCLATSNNNLDVTNYSNFVRTSIDRNILEFKGHGKFGEKLHDIFDQIMVDIELTESRDFIGVMTTAHTEEELADAFWQCFFATCLPETADLDNIKIVCMDLDGVDRQDELRMYIEKFEAGWLPSD